MILFDEVVQIFTAPHFDSLRQLARLLPIRYRPMGGGIGVQRDLRSNPWWLHRLAQKGFGRVYGALPAPIEIHRLASLVHRPVQVDPLASHLYLSFIHAPATAHVNLAFISNVVITLLPPVFIVLAA